MSPSVRTAACLAFASVFAIAALSPAIDRLADASFAWHMVQHLTLFYLVSLFLLLARPFDLLARSLRKPAIATSVRAARPLHVLALPPVALGVFVATLWATHFSPLYELALDHPPVHALEHLLYLTAGIVFWLPVLTVSPLRPLGYPARLFYLIVALPQGALLGMVIASARQPLYAHYAAAGSHAAVLADQGNAAAVMWIAGGLVIFIALLATLGTWARRESEPEPAASRRFAS